MIIIFKGFTNNFIKNRGAERQCESSGLLPEEKKVLQSRKKIYGMTLLINFHI